MMNKEPARRSFLRGKLFWPTPSSLPVSSFLRLPLLITPWPPSLVPTWQTTAWAGVCFSRLSRSRSMTIARRDLSHRAVSVMPVSHRRETVPPGARARAPPPSLHAAKDGGSVVAILSRGSGEEREPNIDTSQQRRAETATRSPLSTCLTS